MPYATYMAIKVALFVDVLLKCPVDLHNICQDTYKDKKRNSIDTLCS